MARTAAKGTCAGLGPSASAMTAALTGVSAVRWKGSTTRWRRATVGYAGLGDGPGHPADAADSEFGEAGGVVPVVGQLNAPSRVNDRARARGRPDERVVASHGAEFHRRQLTPRLSGPSDRRRARHARP